MNQGKYVFAQMVEFLDHHKFGDLATRYGGNKGNRGFTCWNQLLMMLFGQLSNRDSLRDLGTIIEAHKSKAYHLGFGRSICQLLPEPMQVAITVSLRSLRCISFHTPAG